MYVLISTCPHCGAPIYVPYESSSGQPLLSESGLWHAVQEPRFSCQCREIMVVAPVECTPATVTDEVPPRAEYHRPRRTSGYDAIKPSFGVGRKEG